MLRPAPYVTRIVREPAGRLRCLCLVGILSGGGSALAESGLAESALQLDWDAPSECPAREAIQGAVMARVRPNAARPLLARAAAHPDQGQWLLRVRFEGGEREVRGASCAEVAQALTVLLALAIDPLAHNSVSAFPSATAAAPPSVPDAQAGAAAPPAVPQAEPVRPTATAAPAPVNETERREGDARIWRRAGVPARVRLGASLLLLGEAGSLPGPSAGPSAVVRVVGSGWSAELSGSYLAPRWAELPQHPGKGGNISWWAGQLAGCKSAGHGLSACLGAEAGEVLGRGQVVHPVTGHALWLAGAATLVLRVPWSAHWAMESRLGLAVPLVRSSFGLDGYPEAAHETFPLSGRVSLGIAWR